MNTVSLHHFTRGFTRLMDHSNGDEERIMRLGEPLLRELLGSDTWLPEAQARPDPAHYQQYLLYLDPLRRFCVVSFVWGPGQQTPIHDHTVWGLIGILRGAETCENFAWDRDSGRLICTGRRTLHAGDTDRVSPRIGDLHRVSNARPDGVSISIHVYGGDIGHIRRHTYDAASGMAQTFVSGYSVISEPFTAARGGS